MTGSPPPCSHPWPCLQPHDGTAQPGSHLGSVEGVLLPQGRLHRLVLLCPRQGPVQGMGAVAPCPDRRAQAGPGPPWAGDRARPGTPEAGCSPPACCPQRCFYCCQRTGGEAGRMSRDSWLRRGRGAPTPAPSPARRRAGGRQTSFWSGAGRWGRLRAWNAPAQRQRSPPWWSCGAGCPGWARSRALHWRGRSPCCRRPGAAPPPGQGTEGVSAQSTVGREHPELRAWLGLQLSSSSWGSNAELLARNYCCCHGGLPALRHPSGGLGRSGTASHRSGMCSISCRIKAWGGVWPGGSLPSPQSPQTLSPSMPRVPLKGQALHLSLPPVLQQLPLSPPTAAWREKCEQHHQPQPWAGLVPRVRGCSRTGARVSPGEEAVITPSHSDRADIKGRLRAIPRPFPAPAVWFSPGNLPVAEAGTFAAQKGFGL